MEQTIQNQIEHARNNKAGLDGIIRGVRTIKQGKHGSRSSLLYSAKNRGFIAVESRLEQAFCYELEANPNVSAYRTQALAIPYREYELFPDFLVFDLQGNAYVREIKHSSYLASVRTQEKISHLMSAFTLAKTEFGVVIESDLWSTVEKLNWVMLYNRGGRLAISRSLLEWVVKLVISTQNSICNLAFLRQAIRNNGLPFYLLEAAIFKGLLRCRMDRPITLQTIIEVAA